MLLLLSIFTIFHNTYTMMLEMIFFKTNRYWYSYWQICKKAKQSISHRPGMSKGKIMRYLVYRCKVRGNTN